MNLSPDFVSECHRGRCARLLEDPEAFDPRLGRSPPAGSGECRGTQVKGDSRTILPAGLVTDGMLSRLLPGVSNLPSYSTNFVGALTRV
jgi:hypothetical protein